MILNPLKKTEFTCSFDIAAGVDVADVVDVDVVVGLAADR